MTGEHLSLTLAVTSPPHQSSTILLCRASSCLSGWPPSSRWMTACRPDDQGGASAGPPVHGGYPPRHAAADIAHTATAIFPCGQAGRLTFCRGRPSGSERRARCASTIARAVGGRPNRQHV